MNYSKLLCATSALALGGLSASAFAQTADSVVTPTGATSPGYVQLTQAGPAQALPSATPDLPAAAPTGDQLVVTGTRLRTGFATPTPVTVMSSVQLQAIAPNSVGDALAQLPAFLGSSTTSNLGAVSSSSGGAQALLNLRNLGANRTLILLDGERLPASNVNGSVDINVIPQSLISRVDVVTGGASAAYGSDAVAGVVNFVLNTHYKGFELDGDAGETTYNDAQNEHIIATYGTSLLDDRLRLEGSLELFHQNAIGFGPNPRNWYTNESGLVTNSAGAPTALSIIPDVRFSTMTYGGLITTKGAAGLSGMQFGPGGVLEPFNTGTIANTGTAFQSGGDGPYPGNGLSPEQDRGSIFFHGEYDINDKLTAFAEFMYDSSHTDSESAYPFQQTTKAFTIYNNNAYLPASVAALMAADKITSFTLGRYSSDLPPIDNNDTTTLLRYAAGLRGQLDSRWSWDTSFAYSVSDQNYKQRDTINRNLYAAADAVVNPATGQIVCESTLAGYDPGCVPINVLGTNTISSAGAAYVEGWDDGNTTDRQGAFNFNLRGDLGDRFNFGAGPISVATGGAWRLDVASRVVSPLSAEFTSCTGLRAGGCTAYNNTYGGYQSYNPGPLSGQIGVTEGYGETDIPLVKDFPFVKSFDVDLAGRITDYSTSGLTYTYKIGPSWRVTDEFRIRATRSQDIRAPDINELFATVSGSATNNGTFPGSTVVVSGGQNVTVQSITVGNANLKPEVAQTSTVGGVYQPHWLPGFQGSIDYYNIDIAGAIASVAEQTVIDGCYQGNQNYCKLITVAGSPVTTTTGITSSTAGVVVLAAPININTVKTSGLDIELAYNTPVWGGRLNTRALGNYLLTSSNSSNLPTAAIMVGNNSASNPQWTAVLSEDYSHPITDTSSYDFSVQERLISAGYINPNYSAAQINFNTVPEVTYVDMTATYKFKMWQGTNEEIYFNVLNLFNVNPPVDPAASSFMAATNYALYDVLGRRWTLGFRLKL